MTFLDRFGSLIHILLIGALVGMVEEDGPGAKAGIKAGDVVVTVGGTIPALLVLVNPGAPAPLPAFSC